MNQFLINLNHTELKRLLNRLFVHIGLARDMPQAEGITDGWQRAMISVDDPHLLPPRLYRVAQLLLTTLEAATRRLIIYIAAGLPTPELSPREAGAAEAETPRTAREIQQPATAQSSDPPVPDDPPDPDALGEEPVPRRPPPFVLLDPMKRYEWFWNPDYKPKPFHQPDPERGLVMRRDTPLMRRVASLAYALEDLERQARRFAQWRARRNAGLLKPVGGMRIIRLPLRVGRPPGSPPRSTPKSRICSEHAVLTDTDSLARYAMKYHDSS